MAEPPNTDDNQPFRLLDLPPELWIGICSIVSYRSANENDALDSHWPDEKLQAALSQPAITQTCKAIRNELLHYFYSQNQFFFKDDGGDMITGLMAWIKAIGELNYSQIENLYVVSSAVDLQDHVADMRKKENFPFAVQSWQIAENSPSEDARYLIKKYKLEFSPLPDQSTEQVIENGEAS